MTDLSDFIEARLAEEEAHARKDLHLIAAATPLDQWTPGLGYNLPFSEIGEGGSIGRITSTYGRRLADGEADQHRADATLIARLVRRSAVRAERTLREVEAKRRICEQHAPRMVMVMGKDGHSAGSSLHCGQCNPSDPNTRQAHPCTTLRLLALPYADHPDYRSEWSP